MKRQEEIQKLIDEETGIDNYGSSDYQMGVCDGVRLADRTMLKKLCEFLEPPLTAFIGREDAKEFIAKVRQAMEGGAE